MNSKERFLTTCSHQAPDRIPIDYLAHPRLDRKLREYYRVETEADLLDRLACDFYYLSFRDVSQNENHLRFYRGPRLEITEKTRVCPLGIRWTRGIFESKFGVDECIGGPLEKAETPQDILRHPWPKATWFDFDPLHSECEKYKEKVIIGGFWSGIFGDSYRMLGFEDFLLNMAMNPELIKTLVDRMTDFYLELNDRFFSQFKNKIDIWFFGNDFGTQQGLIFSQTMWEDFFLEPIRKMVALAHRYGLKVMMHSCGAISNIIPPLIQAGVDILDPIQVTAVGMQPAALKTKFGKDLVFHGGVDTQQVLPTASPDEVYRHAEETLQTLGRDGGYIFAPSQLLHWDIPVANIDAMYRAARSQP